MLACPATNASNGSVVIVEDKELTSFMLLMGSLIAL